MQQNQSIIQNRNTLKIMNRISNIKSNPLTFQPFPNHQKSKKVCRPLEYTPYYLSGSTWDAKHLDNLVSPKSCSTASKQTRYFKKDKSPYENMSKNQCQYGYTNVFPLIIKPEKQKTLFDYTNQSEIIVPEINLNSGLLSPSKQFQQFNNTRNAFSQYKNQREHKTQSIRMDYILKNSYSHGIQGYQNPESQNPRFSRKLQAQRNLNYQKIKRAATINEKYIKSPVFDKQLHSNEFPKQSHQLSPQFKHKHRQAAYTLIGKERTKRLPNSKTVKRNFNIITNILVE